MSHLQRQVQSSRKQGVDVRYAHIEQNRDSYRPQSLCATLPGSDSGFAACQCGEGPKKLLSECALLARIREIHEETKAAYGSPGIDQECNGRGILPRQYQRGSSKSMLRVHRASGASTWWACILVGVAICVAPVNVASGQSKSVPLTTGGRPSNIDNAALELLDKLTLESFAGVPASFRPFEPIEVRLAWQVHVPSTPEAASIRFAIDSSPIPSRGTMPVRPERITTYHLFATIRNTSRELGTTTVQVNTRPDWCQTTDPLFFTEAGVKQAIEAQIRDFTGPISNLNGTVGADPGRLHIHADIEKQDQFGPVDATARVNTTMTFGLSRGLLNIATDTDVQIDATGPDDLWRLSPSANARYIAARQQLTGIVDNNLPNAFRSVLNRYFDAQFSGVAYRYWAITTTNLEADNSGADGIFFVACRYPQPWKVTVRFLSVRLRDDIERDRVARVRFVFVANNKILRWPSTGTSDFPLVGGESGVVNFPNSSAVSLDLGQLDTLGIHILAVDSDKDAPDCLPGLKPTCTAGPPRHADQAFELVSHFGRGQHSARGNSGGESFEVTYRIEVEYSCPECTGPNPLP